MFSKYANLRNYNMSILNDPPFYIEYPRKPYYNNNNISPHVKFGLDQSGSVYTNPNLFNIKNEDPGISWIL